ncbi:MAG: hypothetical protein ACXWCZ_11320 [Flavisolibacter sp.]
MKISVNVFCIIFLFTIGLVFINGIPQKILLFSLNGQKVKKFKGPFNYKVLIDGIEKKHYVVSLSYSGGYLENIKIDGF